ncbi:MAG: amidohydrolase family protein [Lautropia sp.]
MFDTVIRHATLLDGSGAPGRRASLAVAGTRIVAIGDDLPAGREEVDADGLALMPGIIDGHTHYDAQLTWDPFADPSVEVGVTTAVIGNCGFTIAPCRAPDRGLTMRNLTQVEGMSLAALEAGIRWDFETIPQYLAMLEGAGLGVNVAAFAGHSAIRTYVMGEASHQRAATPAEVARMAAIVRDAMAAGCIGFASSTNEPHNGWGGIPMPSRLADEDELVALTRAMGEGGRGVFMLTKGATTSIAQLERIAQASARPVLIAALLHNDRAWSQTFDEMDAMAAARGRGHRLIPQVSACPLTMEFTLQSAYLFESIPAWRPAISASHQTLMSLYADPAFRAAVKADLDLQQGRGLFNGDWQRLHVAQVVDRARAGLEGESLGALAAREGAHPLDAMLDLALAESLATIFTAQLRNTDEKAVGRMVADPHTHVALSDAGAHLTFMCDAGYGLHLLGHWSRDLRALPIEQAAYKLTGHPADLFGLEDRGRLAVGMAADLLLFDPATVARGRNERRFDLPAGADRLRGGGVGVRGVWLNGARVVDESGRRADPPRAGVLLRGGASRPGS